MENNFDLGKIAIEQTNGKGETVKVVPAGNRTAWFRYVYPQGKISKRIAAMGNDANGNPTITVECRVYCSYNDPDENFLANAFATRSYLPNDPIGQHYQQCAETAAKVRALVDAGFTLVNESFADFDDSGVGSMSATRSKPEIPEYDAAVECEKTGERLSKKESKQPHVAIPGPQEIAEAKTADVSVEQTLRPASELIAEKPVKVRKRSSEDLIVDIPEPEADTEELQKVTHIGGEAVPQETEQKMPDVKLETKKKVGSARKPPGVKSDFESALDVVIHSASAYAGKTFRELLGDERIRQNQEIAVKTLKWIEERKDEQYAEEAAAAATVLGTLMQK